MPHEAVVLAATHGAFVMPEQAVEAHALYVRLLREHLAREVPETDPGSRTV